MDHVQFGTQEYKLAWDVVVVAIGAIVWLVRLEAKILYLEKDHNKLEEKTAKSFASLGDRFDMLKANLSDINKSMARIEMFIERHDKHE